MTHFYGGKKTLKKRFANIFNAGVRKRGTAAFVAVILIASFLATTVSCVAANPEEEQTPPTSQSEQQIPTDDVQNTDVSQDGDGQSPAAEVQEPELPPPSERTLAEVERLFAAFNGESEEDISSVPTVGTKTVGLEQFESFLGSVAENKPASMMSFVYGSPLIYVIELSYTPTEGIRLYTFDDYFNEYNGYEVTKVYETELFYQFTNGKNLFFSVPKYSEITETEISESELAGASVASYDAANAAATMYTLVYNMSLEQDSKGSQKGWHGSFAGTVIPEDYFPTDYNGNFYGEAVGGAVINGEEYHKIEVYQYDENKNTLPFDGTVYYVNAENIHKMFSVNQAHGYLYPVARIYDSALTHDPVTAPYALGQYGEIRDLKVGDKIGFWTLESLERGYLDWPAQDEIEAVFTGEVELYGYLSLHTTAEDEMYDFTVNTQSSYDMPRYIDEYFEQGVVYDNQFFIIRDFSAVENFPKLDDKEVLECKITVTRFKDAHGFYVGYPEATVTKVEPLANRPKMYTFNCESFGLGPDSPNNGNKEKLLYINDTIGEWTAEDIQTNEDEIGQTIYVKADFTGNVTLNGRVSKDSESELYEFLIDETDLEKMPYHWNAEMRGPRNTVYFNYMDGENPVLNALKAGENKLCTITVSKYYFKDDTRKQTRSTVEITAINIDGVTYYQDTNFATFRLGPDGEDKNLRQGDKLGQWILSELSVSYLDYDLTYDEVDATFTGGVYFSGYLERDPLGGELDLFTIDEYYIDSLPFFVSEDGVSKSGSRTVTLDLPEEIASTLPDLEYEERYYCSIWAYSYEYEYAHRMTAPTLKVSSFEPDEERNRNAGSYFSLGRDGEVKFIPAGESIGEWKLLNYSDDGKFREAAFTGEVVLTGTVSAHTYAESGYLMFTIDEADLARMPYHQDTDWDHQTISLSVWNIPPIENLGTGSAPCSIKVIKYNYLDAAMSANTTFVVSEITIDGQTYKV